MTVGHRQQRLDSCDELLACVNKHASKGAVKHLQY